jgi:hypothetical protein
VLVLFSMTTSLIRLCRAVSAHPSSEGVGLGSLVAASLGRALDDEGRTCLCKCGTNLDICDKNAQTQLDCFGLPQQSQKFALLKGRNDTWRPEQDGVWAINTGQRDRRQFGKVASWNSYKKLPFWPAPQCNVINGSDGTLFPPPIKSSEPLYIFNQELCFENLIIGPMRQMIFALVIVEILY